MKRALPLLLAGCLDSHVDFVGKLCSDARACPGGLVCVAGRCAESAPMGCTVPEPQLTCTLRDVALAAGATPNAADLVPGTRFVLARGDYGPLRLSGSGTAGCPIVIAGQSDGSSRFTDTLTLDGSNLRVLDVSFEVTQRLYALTTTNGARSIDLRRLHFRSTATARAPSTSEYPFDVYLESSCGDVTVSESDFTGTRAPGFFSDSSCGAVAVKGNRFALDGQGPTVQIEATAGGEVSGNTFSGATRTSVVEFVNGGAGVVRRNWFEGLTSSSAVAVVGAREISSNTFTDVAGDAASCAETFADNAVVRTRAGVTCGTAARAYNLYDAVTNAGTLTSTELAAQSQLGSDGIPLEGSAAIDAADPSLAVPAGGGQRADIGAFERGARRRSDGEYCP